MNGERRRNAESFGIVLFLRKLDRIAQYDASFEGMNSNESDAEFPVDRKHVRLLHGCTVLLSLSDWVARDLACEISKANLR